MLITLVDRRNFHLFQPLLYQVATGALSPGEIAYPLRGVFARQPNVRVLMAEVSGVDLARRRIYLEGSGGGQNDELAYETLVIAAGASHSYFGQDEWEQDAPGLKTLEDALEIRRRVLSAFEAAELESDPARRRAWLTFVVVGGGPTGVELAGQIVEIARDTLKRDFRQIDSTQARVLLVEAVDRVLSAYDPRLSDRAVDALRRLGVTPMLGTRVVGIDEDSISVAAQDDVPRQLSARTIIWAAGVMASPLARELADTSGGELDRAGRLTVESDLTLPGHADVFVLGDMVRVSDGHGGTQPIPGVAPAAMQQGSHVARMIQARLENREVQAFVYRDKGSLATIGRKAAVAEIGRARLSGSVAWVAWLFVHLYFLMGMQNRLIVLVRWSVSFITRGRGARLITGPDMT